jgi:hypothetical protein
MEPPMSAAPTARTAGPVVTEPEELTPEWLSAALSSADGEVHVGEARVEPIGSGQIGSCYRVALEGDGTPPSLVAKLPTPDPAVRELLVGVYRTEVRFYTEIAPTVDVATPRCHYGAMAADSPGFTLLLEDVRGAAQGDQLRGCSPEEAAAAVVNLAGLHGPRWCDPELTTIEGLSLTGKEAATLLGELYGPAVEEFLDRLGHRFDPTDHRTLRETAEVVAAWSLARPERFGLVHGDYRLDNLLFADPTHAEAPAEMPAVTAVDWQTLGLGLPARDLAFILGTGMPVEDRREHERALVAAYHQRLTGYGVEDHPLDECWEDYRFAMVQGPLISVFGCAYGTPTARGDDMFTVMVQRSCAAIRDLGTLALVG